MTVLWVEDVGAGRAFWLAGRQTGSYISVNTGQSGSIWRKSAKSGSYLKSPLLAQIFNFLPKKLEFLGKAALWDVLHGFRPKSGALPQPV
jgi:hypothetical protein